MPWTGWSQVLRGTRGNASLQPLFNIAAAEGVDREFVYVSHMRCLPLPRDDVPSVQLIEYYQIAQISASSVARRLVV